ncbi:uncharacterized protein UBRO_03449 [Ustilago bromivora]|uniref:Snf7-domain-containing protein n=1 Tax=Ustilago bromivora TaxID=307758 RepID=A0A1K0G5Z0_9BASI|nr:uncharacterized protein UBRO_03449 [Ustilago bromivora]SYW84310.1 uncharacterized protein UBRO2_05410 [Ustilago bromivora]
MTPKTGLTKYISQHPDFSSPSSHASPLPSLYADLSRQRKSNPAGFAASVEWWKTILLDVTFRAVQFDADPSDSSNAAFSAPEVDRTIFRLDESTKSRWTIESVGRPLGLGTVIAELEKNGAVIPYNVFLTSSKPITGPTRRGGGLRGYVPTLGGVARGLLVTPVKWVAGQVYAVVLGGSGDEDGEGEYSEDEALFRKMKGDWVFFVLVERIADAFLKQHYTAEATISPLSGLMTETEFREKLCAICEKEFAFRPSQRDASLVLRHLTRDRGGNVLHQDGIVKLAPTEGEMAEAITEEDRSVLAVRSILHRVELQITWLESQISHRTSQAKSSLRNNQKSQAASYLRSRKALDEVLEKRMVTRETLTNVVLKIEQAKSDVEVLGAYKASDEVLRQVLDREEMKVENVERVMEGLEESLASQREVDDALRGSGTGVGGEMVDEEELERELERLVDEKRREEQKRQDQVERTKRLAEREEERRQEEMEPTRRLAEAERERTNRLAQSEREREDREQEREREKEKEKEKGRSDKEADDLLARFEKLRAAQVPTTLGAAGKETQSPQEQQQKQNEPEAAS